MYQRTYGSQRKKIEIRERSESHQSRQRSSLLSQIPSVLYQLRQHVTTGHAAELASDADLRSVLPLVLPIAITAVSGGTLLHRFQVL